MLFEYLVNELCCFTLSGRSFPSTWTCESCDNGLDIFFQRCRMINEIYPLAVSVNRLPLR